MKYRTQAIIGVCGIVGVALMLVMAYSFFTDVHWILPAFSIPFMGGFGYYTWASLKEKREKKERRKRGN